MTRKCVECKRVIPEDEPAIDLKLNDNIIILSRCLNCIPFKELDSTIDHIKKKEREG